MTQAELLGSIHDLSRAVAQLTSERGHCQRGACSHASTHCRFHSSFPLSALRPDPDRLQINFTTWNAANTNYERKAHLEGRQKSAPFSVSQLSPPPHHVFPKPGAVPSTKCTGKHILGPAVIWSWRAGCGWIRNQPIGPGTMRPLVRLREGPPPSAPPPSSFPSQPSGEQDARTASVACPFPPALCWTTAIFCFEWHTPCVVRDFGWRLLQPLWKWIHCKPRADTGIYVQAPTGQPQQQHLGSRFLWNPKGWKPPGKLLLISPTEHSMHCTDQSQEPDFIWPHNFADVL